MVLTCPRCHADAAPGDRFCAECGGRIAAPEAQDAGAVTIGPGLAARTDPGVRHANNQDAVMLSGPAAGGAGTVMVVCDGVSNSQTPELASSTAARVAHAALVSGLDMAAAIRRAHDAVCALPFDRQGEVDPPATTMVAATIREGGTVLGWLGDSRAYALGPDPALLTRDHSWLVDVLDRGLMLEAEASRHPLAHALLHCLGTTDFARATPCPEPSVLTLPPRPGWLLLCSDGLWNYAPSAPGLLLEAHGLDSDAADICARLVSFARGRGGHDNITAAAARWA